MSRVLIDTQSLIWFAEDTANLSRRAVALVDDPATIRLASAASLWEMAIKIALGKLSLKAGTLSDFVRLLRANDVEVLPVWRATPSRWQTFRPTPRTRIRSTV